MGNCTTGLGLFLFFALPNAAFAEEPVQQTAEQTATVPFNPPLGTPLHYRLLRSSNFSQNNSTLEQELVYSKTADGYQLQIKTTKLVQSGMTYGEGTIIPMPNHAEDIPIRPEDILLLQSPVTLRLSLSGQVIAIDDWDSLRQQLRELPDGLAARVPAEARTRFRDTVAAVVLPMAEVSDRTATTFIAREWPAILMFGGARVPVGTKIEGKGQTFPLGPAVPVATTMDVMLTRLPSGGVRLVSNQLMNKADLTEAIDHFEQQSAHFATSSDGRAARQSQFSSVRGSDRSSGTQVDLDDRGVLQSGFWNSQSNRDGETVRFDRVDFELVH